MDATQCERIMQRSLAISDEKGGFEAVTLV